MKNLSNKRFQTRHGARSQSSANCAGPSKRTSRSCPQEKPRKAGFQNKGKTFPGSPALLRCTGWKTSYHLPVLHQEDLGQRPSAGNPSSSGGILQPMGNYENQTLTYFISFHFFSIFSVSLPDTKQIVQESLGQVFFIRGQLAKL